MTTLAGFLFGAALSAWDVITTALLGLTLDPFYIALVLVRGIILGSAFADPSPNLQHGIIAHLVGGTATGFLAGVLLPLGQRRTSAIVGGTVAILPFFIGAAMVLEGSWASWHYATIVSIGLVSLGMGGANGYLIWEDHDLDPQRPTTTSVSRKRLFRGWKEASRRR